jgi:hypothetical protein
MYSSGKIGMELPLTGYSYRLITTASLDRHFLIAQVAELQVDHNESLMVEGIVVNQLFNALERAA